MSPSQPPDADRPAFVPLSLLDDVLAAVAAALHDRPVQSTVAARLMIETALHSPDPPAGGPQGRPGDQALLDRGLTAIAHAAEQSRDIMWALGDVAIRPQHIAVDISEVVARVAAPGTTVSTTVTVDPDVDPVGLASLVRAVREVLADLMLAGSPVMQVSVASDAEGLHAMVRSGHGDADSGTSPWVQLATARVRASGGDLEVWRDGAVQVTELSVPLP